MAVVLLAGCGSAASSGTGISPLVPPAATSGPVSTHSITSATTERNKLLALARVGTSLTPQGTVPGWPPANGSGIPATSSEVSGFGFVVDKARNVQYLSFAVMDAAGRCAGGDLEANSSDAVVSSARPITMPRKAPCTGDEAAKLAGHRS